ncbi:DUF4861 domain-containing protein [Anditalea andensis]|uniref:Rhamnogalacturonyl hydrolase n=1 Tax=Anditalea andensis TaxID=1048983 RepID=A0A074LFU4_9BACT|nr:DUF4861 domain-containing protein [Anditalea andensis]KEO72637.1 rhamnogalacturonyl hydrolase [Anditalea andensis]
MNLSYLYYKFAIVLSSFFFGMFNMPCLYGQSEDPLPNAILFTVQNPMERSRFDILVHIEERELLLKYPDFNKKGFKVFRGQEEIPSQYNELGTDKGIVFVISEMNAKEEQYFTIHFDPKVNIENHYVKKTQAEISHKVGGHFENRKYIGGSFQNVSELHVPAAHTDHSWYIRYEGPGWESDKVGYRFYLDWRNGVDVFGKTTPNPILQMVGQDGFDSYHELQEWGMDVLKVGKSLGVGSIATFTDGQARRVDETDSLYAGITNNGPVYSSVLTKYFGWNLKNNKTTITSHISIHAGTRMSKQELNSSADIENFATGLIKDPKGKVLQGGESTAYGYLATYGPQSLNDDNLGIAVLFRNDQKKEITTDTHSHVVVLTPVNNNLTYYFLAAWEKEKNGIRDELSFISYLEELVEELSNPVHITIN